MRDKFKLFVLSTLIIIPLTLGLESIWDIENIYLAYMGFFVFVSIIAYLIFDIILIILLIKERRKGKLELAILLLPLFILLPSFILAATIDNPADDPFFNNFLYELLLSVILICLCIHYLAKERHVKRRNKK